MKSILLKIDDQLYSDVEASAKKLKITKTGFIKKAITIYDRAIKRKNLEVHLAKEIALIKADKEGLAEIYEWKEASLKDLSEYLDNLENE